MPRALRGAVAGEWRPGPEDRTGRRLGAGVDRPRRAL